MDQVFSTSTPARMPRMVSRTLIIVGGAVAGTAIAWAISAAAASAETDPIPDVPIVAELTEPVQDLVTGVERIGHPTPPPAPKPIADLGQQVADQLGWLPELPVDDIDPVDPPRGADPAPGDVPPMAGPVDDRPAFAPITGPRPGIDPAAHAAGGAQDRALADGMSRRGSPAPVPVLPSLPTPPGAPATMPAHGSTGPAGGADSPAFAALPWQDRTARPVSDNAAPATGAHVPDQAGTRPGVTPD